jgi:hypothetical protein
VEDVYYIRVYSEKQDGTNTSGTVSQGFTKVTGMDFTDSHAHVQTYIACRLALIIDELIKYVLSNLILKQNSCTQIWKKRPTCESLRTMQDTSLKYTI